MIPSIKVYVAEARERLIYAGFRFQVSSHIFTQLPISLYNSLLVPQSDTEV